MFEDLKNIFSGGGSDFENWNRLEDIVEWERIFKKSGRKPQILYKHSNRCSVSWFAKSKLEKASETLAEKADMHVVDVIRNREVSNYIAENLELRHESPQAILVKDEKVVWHASHGSINENKMLEALN